MQGNGAIHQVPVPEQEEEKGPNAEGSEEEVRDAARADDGDQTDPDELQIGEEGPVRYYEDSNERLI